MRGEELEAFDRSIDVHVSRIRAEIEEDPKQPKYIRTVRGAGYVFTPPSLVKQIAEAHRGRVMCADRDGGGTSFIVELPVASAPA